MDGWINNNLLQVRTRHHHHHHRHLRRGWCVAHCRLDCNDVQDTSLFSTARPWLGTADELSDLLHLFGCVSLRSGARQYYNKICLPIVQMAQDCRDNRSCWSAQRSEACRAPYLRCPSDRQIEARVNSMKQDTKALVARRSRSRRINAVLQVVGFGAVALVDRSIDRSSYVNDIDMTLIYMLLGNRWSVS